MSKKVAWVRNAPSKSKSKSYSERASARDEKVTGQGDLSFFWLSFFTLQLHALHMLRFSFIRISSLIRLGLNCIWKTRDSSPATKTSNFSPPTLRYSARLAILFALHLLLKKESRQEFAFHLVLFTLYLLSWSSFSVSLHLHTLLLGLVTDAWLDLRPFSRGLRHALLSLLFQLSSAHGQAVALAIWFTIFFS